MVFSFHWKPNHAAKNEETKLRYMKVYSFYSFRCALSKTIERIDGRLPEIFTDSMFVDVVGKELWDSYGPLCQSYGKTRVDRWLKRDYLRIRSDLFRREDACKLNDGRILQFKISDKRWRKILN